jgi:inosose dehydratase
LPNLRLGTAPDSWGVWFPDHPDQAPWHQFLDEASAAGYRWVELGPYGYLPTEPEQLGDELGKRGLRLSGAGVFAGLHRGPEAFKTAVANCLEVSHLLAAMGAAHIVLLPESYRDLEGGDTQARELTSAQWHDLARGMSELGRVVADEAGMSINFHPHADSHVDRQPLIEKLLADTDPRFVKLCLDTGHVAYCGGDNLELVKKYPDRIGYVHLKSVNPVVVQQVAESDLCFAEAVQLGAMVEPGDGIPAMEQLLGEFAKLGVDLFTIVEQDMFPCRPDAPLPIATRTHQFYVSRGLGTGLMDD